MNDVRAETRSRIAGCLCGLSVMSGVRYEPDYNYCCPSLTNDAAVWIPRHCTLSCQPIAV